MTAPREFVTCRDCVFSKMRADLGGKLVCMLVPPTTIMAEGPTGMRTVSTHPIVELDWGCSKGMKPRVVM
jgi:hypothetical protein